jgi:nickel/cobalt exporter
MRNRSSRLRSLLAALVALCFTLAPSPLSAHPMGNFSISHYAGIRIERGFVELTYMIDMAEIPTFQEMQQSGIVADASDPRVEAYLARQAENFKKGLTITVNGRPVFLELMAKQILFSQGAGNLPTTKLGMVYRGGISESCSADNCQLSYRDANFPDRIGWKEIVAGPGPGVSFESSTAPAYDRSTRLSNYPTDLVNSPPRDLEATIAFRVAPESSGSVSGVAESKKIRATASVNQLQRNQTANQRALPANSTAASPPMQLQTNQQPATKNAFTQLMSSNQIGFGVAFLAALIAVGLGALHALEPGHGKTVVAAYLVGSKGTALDALLLGLIVTISHTTGVYLLGGLTLYAQKYVMPDRLYPFLGVLSGMLIAGMGFYLFLQRYVGGEFAHSHGPGGHRHFWDVPATNSESLAEASARGAGWQVDARNENRTPSARELLVLGITGGIVPCPAALVVLLSAVALHRVAFGLFLIVSFSLGLAAVLVGMGLAVVYAKRAMSFLSAEGPLTQRWLPLTSAAMIGILGCAIAVRSLMVAGIVQIRI